MQFEYNIPFGEVMTALRKNPSSGSNETFELKISGIDVLSKTRKRKSIFNHCDYNLQTRYS